MDIHYWWCGNCGNSYLEKPSRCALADAIAPGGWKIGCDKYPMNEEIIRNVTGYREYCTDIAIGLVKADGTCEDINFQGDDAWERREAFMKLIGREA